MLFRGDGFVLMWFVLGVVTVVFCCVFLGSCGCWIVSLDLLWFFGLCWLVSYSLCLVPSGFVWFV